MVDGEIGRLEMIPNTAEIGLIKTITKITTKTMIMTMIMTTMRSSVKVRNTRKRNAQTGL